MQNGETDHPQWKELCYKKHHPLEVGKYQIYGGSASQPIVKDAEVYVSLQEGSTCGCISDPWEEHRVIEVQHFIRDGRSPSDPVRFKKLIEWICNQLQSGKKIHVGCIGGHGRTGLVLSCVVRMLLEEKDATTYVRNHYCPRAVESQAQEKFLHQYFGIKEVGGYKEFEFYKKPSFFPSQGHLHPGSLYSKNGKNEAKILPSYDSVFNFHIKEKEEEGHTLLTPIRSKRNLWLS